MCTLADQYAHGKLKAGMEMQSELDQNFHVYIRARAQKMLPPRSRRRSFICVLKLFTNIDLSSVDKPEEIWTNRWENTLGESKLYGNMVGDLLKGVIRAAGWLQLDLILYGPRTILNSFNNLFR